jgi:hypothetical protein
MMTKPNTAFAFLLIGGILILIQGIIYGLTIIYAGIAIATIYGAGFFGGLLAVLGVILIMFGIILIGGALMVNTGEPNKVRSGSIIGILFGALSIFFGGGFYTGFMLSIIGGILGLTWKPEQPSQSTSQQPTQA